MADGGQRSALNWSEVGRDLRAAQQGQPYLSFSEPLALNPPSAIGHRPSAGPVVPLGLAQMDWNEDGVPDLVQGGIAASGGLVRLWQADYDQRQAATRFTEAGAVMTGVIPALMAAGDFNGDAHQDVIVTDQQQNQFLFLAGDGHGQFRSQRVGTSGPVRAMVVADLPRRDGHDDLVVGVGGRKLLIYDRWDFGFTGLPQTIPLPEEVVGITLTDFNGDHVKDLLLTLTNQMVVLYGSNTKRYTLGTGVGARRWTVLPLESEAMGAVADDFTGDRRRDVMVWTASGWLQLYTNGGLNPAAVGGPDDPLPARFARLDEGVTMATAGAVQINAANLDGDRAHDVVALDRAGRRVIMIRGNQMTETFEPPMAFPLDDVPVALLCGRLNADARDDVVILNSDGEVSALMSMAAGDPVVTKTADTNDGVCDADCSLREAIIAANAGSGPQTITFNIPTSDPGFADGVFTLWLGSQLPALTNFNGTTVDGASQMLLTGDTNNGHPVIVIDGNGADFGFVINADSHTISKVQLIDCEGLSPTTAAVNIGFSDNNQVKGCYIGFLQTTAGTLSDMTVDNTIGVLINNGADLNQIGGTNADDRNVISNNSFFGVFLRGPGTFDNQALGNFIGTTTDGMAADANAIHGVFIDGNNGPVASTTIGGVSAGAGNVISGNNQIGVLIGGSGATGNVVQGNFIGTDAGGTLDVGNTSSGVIIFDAPGNAIGGTNAGARNLISGNNASGVVISGSGAMGNLVQGNFIGTDASGTLDVGNTSSGMLILNAPSNIIGGVSDGAGNVISGNDQGGVVIASGATMNRVMGNFIGTDVTGTLDVGNTFDGLVISSAAGNVIGGDSAGAGNVISGNNQSGVAITGADATGNVVQGNFIGTDVTGTLDVGNTIHGVFIAGSASNNTIGGTAAGARNVISGNAAHGVGIFSGASGNQVQGNFIGTDVTGTLDVGNTLDGVFILNSPNNRIGGTDPGAGNVISGNNTDGVEIISSTAVRVQGNLIGTQADGVSALGNSSHGVAVFVCNDTIIGGPGASNVIAHNGGDGVFVTGNLGNHIRSNSIHANTGLGIDLGTNGVTPNDLNDGDLGANSLQNFPVLTLAASSGGSTTLSGTLNSTSNTNFSLEFFVNDACDPLGFGEGQTLIGQGMVMTMGNDASFTFTFPVTVSPTQFITATATDPNGNTSEFSACVQVCTIMCPANLTQSTDPNQCTAVVAYSTATITGACGTVTCLPPSGATLAVGTTTVTCTTTAGPSCSFTVTVNDAQPPSLGSCPTNITTTAPPMACVAAVTYSTPSVIDNCLASVMCAPASGSSFPVGTTTVTCTASDAAGNTATCSFTVTVDDAAAPTINCAAVPAQTASANSACQAPVPDVRALVRAQSSDNCTAQASLAITQTPLPGSSVSGFGAHPITVTVSDSSGNSTNCVVAFTVVDTTGPALACPTNLTVPQNPPGSGSATVTYTTPTATDNCSGTVTATCMPPSGSSFSVGTTTVTCTASDAASNARSCTFTVTVSPSCTITCPGNLTRSAGSGPCGATVTYPTPTTTGSCGPVTCWPPSGSVFALGTTTVTCTTSAGPSCTFTVTVTNAAPTANAGPDQTVDEGATVTLNGAASSDPNAGQTLTFQWTQTGGPAVTLLNANTPMATFTAPDAADLMCLTLTFQLKVTDACGAMSTDTVVVTVSDTFVLQDDRNGHCVTVRRACNSNTATYCWRKPDGSSISGPCTILIQGNTVNLQSTAADPNLLQGSADLMRHTGNARLTAPRGSRTTLTIGDSNITNSTCHCP
jgi:CSLREA domain-containing protein